MHREEQSVRQINLTTTVSEAYDSEQCCSAVPHLTEQREYEVIAVYAVQVRTHLMHELVRQCEE